MDGSDGVYPSSEDTFLLIDVLTADADFLRQIVKNGGLCIELGCGSGEVTKALSSILPQSFCVGSDINMLAVKKTKQLLEGEAVVNVDCLRGDMFSFFHPGVLFDVIVFNPPYVPTDQDELDRALKKQDIAASWAGGKDGREVIDKFISKFVRFLSSRGVMYLVLLSANNPEEIREIGQRQGCVVKIMQTRRAGIEELHILRFQNMTSS